MKQLFWRVLLLLPGRDASPSSQGYFGQYVASTQLFTWVERDDIEWSFLSKETTRWQCKVSLEITLGVTPHRKCHTRCHENRKSGQNHAKWKFIDKPYCYKWERVWVQVTYPVPGEKLATLYTFILGDLGTLGNRSDEWGPRLGRPIGSCIPGPCLDEPIRGKLCSPRQQKERQQLNTLVT